MRFWYSYCIPTGSFIHSANLYYWHPVCLALLEALRMGQWAVMATSLLFPFSFKHGFHPPFLPPHKSSPVLASWNLLFPFPAEILTWLAPSCHRFWHSVTLSGRGGPPRGDRRGVVLTLERNNVATRQITRTSCAMTWFCFHTNKEMGPYIFKSIKPLICSYF